MLFKRELLVLLILSVQVNRLKHGGMLGSPCVPAGGRWGDGGGLGLGVSLVKKCKMVKRLSLLREVILVKTTRVRKVSEFKSSTLHPCPFFSPFVYSSTILFCKKKRSTRWTIYGKNICLKFYDPTVMSPCGWRYRSNCRSQVWLNCSPQTPTSSAITPDFIALLYHSILTPLCYMSNSGALHSVDSNTDTTTQWQFFFSYNLKYVYRNTKYFPTTFMRFFNICLLLRLGRP